MSLFKSQYYDKPDGEDYVGKMFASNRNAGTVALGAAAVDVLMYTHPKGYLPTIARIMWWLGPAVGMASAFTTGAYVSHQLRGKDDKVNYVVGAVSAAGVCGAWQKSKAVGLSMCIFFSMAACIKKTSLQEGWLFFPPPKSHQFSGMNSNRNDYTLTPVGEKGWTKGGQ